MRKYSLVLLLVAVLVSFSGCGSGNGNDSKNDQAASDTEANFYVTDEEGFETLDLQAVAEAGQQQMDDMYGHMSDTMTFKVFIRDENLVYACTYSTEIAEENMEPLRAELERGTQLMRTYYYELAQSLYMAGGYDSSVVIEYYTKDEELIYSDEITYVPQNW